MKIFARVVEGNQEDMVFDAACSQDGYNELWNKGKEMWDSGALSKYEIGVFTDDLHLFWSIRPDQWNFESNRHKDCFIEYAEEELKSFLSSDFQNDRLEMEFVKKKQTLWLNNPMFMEKAGANGSLKVSLDEKLDFAKEKAGVSGKGKVSDKDMERI